MSIQNEPTQDLWDGKYKPYIAPLPTRATLRRERLKKRHTAAAKQSQRLCKGYTKKGKLCSQPVRGDSDYCCEAHARNLPRTGRPKKEKRLKTRCIGTTKAGGQCKIRTRRDPPYCKAHRHQKGQDPEPKQPISTNGKLMRDALSSHIVESVEPRPEDYSEYLKCEHWAAVKKSVRQAYGNRCQMCNTNERTLHVHHRTYNRIGQELWADVLLLCEECHRHFHGKAKGQE